MAEETLTDAQMEERLQARLAELPKPVRDAIKSASVTEHLRSLAQQYKLHVDQWELLENEVRLTMLGFQPAEKLQENIKTEVGVSSDRAAELALEISKQIFEPIRQELERELEHPEAKAAQVSGVEAARTAALNEEKGVAAPKAATVAPATPPQPAPTDTVARAPIAPSAEARLPSAERKTIEGDPYREQLA